MSVSVTMTMTMTIDRNRDSAGKNQPETMMLVYIVELDVQLGGAREGADGAVVAKQQRYSERQMEREKERERERERERDKERDIKKWSEFTKIPPT